MQLFDKSPNVNQWSSESISIPYYNPLAKRQSVYIPDFFVTFLDKKGKLHAELMEVKPAKEVPGAPVGRGKSGELTRLAQILNAAKWMAAMAFCKKRGIRFRVLTEHDIYSMDRKK
jgi:hypothetical protein